MSGRGDGLTSTTSLPATVHAPLGHGSVYDLGPKAAARAGRRADRGGTSVARLVLGHRGQVIDGDRELLPLPNWMSARG